MFDANQHPLAVQVIANGSGTYTVQLPNVPGNTSFYVEVVAANPNGSHSTGRFSLAVDFHEPNLVSFGTLTSGSLSQAKPQATGTLTMTEDALFHFALTATSANPKASALHRPGGNGRKIGRRFRRPPLFPAHSRLR